MMGAFRSLSVAGIAVATYLLGAEHTGILLIIFLFLNTTNAMSGGMAGIAFLDIVGKNIPAIASRNNPGRGSFFGWRLFLGAISGICIGFLVINPALKNISYPDNFALIFGIAAVCIALGVIAFGSVNESPVEDAKPQIPLKEHLRKSFRLLKIDVTFRRYFRMRHLLMFWMLGMPFYILYAKSQFLLTPFWVGFYLATRFTGEMIFNFMWAKLSDGGHNRLVLRGAAIIAILPPVICFAQYYFDLPELFFALAFFFSGGVVTGAIIGGNNFLLQHAPSEIRPRYIGIMSSTLGITTLSAGIGGIIVDHLGYMILFVLVGLIALTSLFSAVKLSPANINN